VGLGGYLTSNLSLLPDERRDKISGCGRGLVFLRVGENGWERLGVGEASNCGGGVTDVSETSMEVNPWDCNACWAGSDSVSVSKSSYTLVGVAAKVVGRKDGACGSSVAGGSMLEVGSGRSL
jgi:hypothetical protein